MNEVEVIFFVEEPHKKGACRLATGTRRSPDGRDSFPSGSRAVIFPLFDKKIKPTVPKCFDVSHTASGTFGTVCILPTR